MPGAKCGKWQSAFELDRAHNESVSGAAASCGSTRTTNHGPMPRSHSRLEQHHRAYCGLAGLLSPSAVGALLDASGFAYGDALDEWPAQRSARLYQSFTESGKPVILLPQAFGPFRRPNVAAATRAALEMAAMIIARDPDSLGHLRSLNLHSPEVRMAPDFTNLLQPRPDTQWNGVVALIPDMRMIDMGASLDEAKYVAFLKACALAAADAGYRVGVVAHEPGDRRLGRRVADDLDTEVLECRDTDPLATKALIGGCALVVSSRYHGLVNAMSQGVPAIGTGWSHKYSYLFDDYGCREALWDVSDVSSVRERLGQELQPHSLAARREPARASGEAPRGGRRHVGARPCGAGASIGRRNLQASVPLSLLATSDRIDQFQVFAPIAGAQCCALVLARWRGPTIAPSPRAPL